MTLLLALAAACLVSAAIERRGGSEPFGHRPADLAMRFGSYALLTLAWFVFSWRPWLAGLSTVLTVAGLVIVSRMKRAVIGEPLVFSDFALLPQVPRHPQLYYIPPVTSPIIAGPALVSIAAIALWFWLEPTLLPSSAAASLIAVVALPAALSALVLAALRPPVSGWLARRFPRPEPERDIGRVGLPATLAAYALRHRTEAAAAEPLPAVPTLPGEPVVVVIQLESFVDPERLGGPPLPLMELIRSRASEYGRLRVPAHGAYTMRSEHAVLTGRDADSLGFGRFDPYLAGGGDEPTSLARIAAGAGYDTAFVHPFHRDFFQRAQVMRRLGFRRLVMEEDFAGAPRVGPYMSDVALGAHILEEVRARRGPLFLFSVTMENHGPWKPGRLPGIDDPLAQYLHHVAGTGRMVEDLVAGLAGERAVLCVFGDHAPSLPTCRPGFGDTSTDYALFRFGGPQGAPRRIDRTADALGRRLRDTLAPESTAPATPGPAQA